MSGEHASAYSGESSVRQELHTGSVDLTRAEVHIQPFDAEAWYGRHVGTYERLVKPVIDRLGALVLLIIAAPALLAASVAILITMGRPIFLRQPRVGQYGRVFTLVKLRTMNPDRRTQQIDFVGVDRRRTHKHPSDPRITPVGRFLRKWSLDEIPQFWNVLIGDMSLVGPRPELVDIVSRYQDWQHRRHAVKPGITCIWQVAERGDLALHEATHMDLQYVDSVTMVNDLRLLALTPFAAMGMRTGH